jgi:hypothetical protein
MKFLIIALTALVFSSSALALGVPGKYQLELLNDLSGESGTFEFLMNSDGEVKFLSEPDGYYIQDFQVTSFFGNFDFSIEWGSDEDHHYYLFSLAKENGDVIMTKSCSLYEDGPGGYSDPDGAAMTLSRWNKKTKSYDEVKIVQSNDVFESCQKDIEKRFL